MDELTIRRAEKLLDNGMDAIEGGDLKLARSRFRASAKEYLSAEALTYWGWMEHQLGNTRLAITLCQYAIEVDPEFGNPYNDVGSYLISLGRLDEAIPWLERATQARFYEPRQFPHMNLGRVYLAKKQYDKALTEFKRAQEYAPNNAEILAIIETLNMTIS